MGREGVEKRFFLEFFVLWNFLVWENKIGLVSLILLLVSFLE